MKRTFFLLSFRSPSWLRIRATQKPQSANELPSFSQRPLDPVPADLEVATAAEPMGIDPTPLPLLGHLRPLRDQVERAQRQHEAESR